jgi:hypothetical protein
MSGTVLIGYPFNAGQRTKTDQDLVRTAQSSADALS